MSRTDKDAAKQEVLCANSSGKKVAQQMRHLYKPSLIHSRAHVRKYMIAGYIYIYIYSGSKLALGLAQTRINICHYCTLESLHIVSLIEPTFH